MTPARIASETSLFAIHDSAPSRFLVSKKHGSIDKIISAWNPVEYMAEKNFDEWNVIKKSLQLCRAAKNFRPGEVWFCSIGLNIGREQDGKNHYFERPVLIIKKFNDEIFWAVPLTSKLKVGPYYYSLVHNGRIETAILSQLSLVDVGRLQRKAFRIDVVHRQAIRDQIKRML